jgi:hypothetical protein
MLKKIIITVIIAFIVGLVVFLVIRFSDDNIDAVPDSIIEQENAIIDNEKALNKAKTLKTTRRLDELKKEEAELEKEDKNKKVNTKSNIDSLLKRYKRYAPIGK